MHKEVRNFIKQVRKKHLSHFCSSKVLECGSRIINGSPRKYFWFCDYTGIDLSLAEGVDMVQAAHKYDAPETYNVVISTEMLEHDRYWKKSLQKMYSNLRTGGLLLVTCAGPDRAEHGTKRTSPDDSPDTTNYYRNISIEDFSYILSAEYFSEYYICYGRDQKDLYFYGIKA